MSTQIFHKNNAKVVRSQTVVKAYEFHLRNVRGAPFTEKDHGAAREYNLATCGVLGDNGHYRAKRVKSGKRVVRRIKF